MGLFLEHAIHYTLKRALNFATKHLPFFAFPKGIAFEVDIRGVNKLDTTAHEVPVHFGPETLDFGRRCSARENDRGIPQRELHPLGILGPNLTLSVALLVGSPGTRDGSLTGKEFVDVGDITIGV